MTVLVAPGQQQVRELLRGRMRKADGADVVVPRLALLGEDAGRLAARATVACIGPVTAEAARDAGLTVAVQPSTFTGEALVRALEEAT